MSTESDTSEQPAVSSLHENAQNLLLALSDAEDYRASTSDLKKPTGLSSSNISGRHAKTLIREGWAKKVGLIHQQMFKFSLAARSSAPSTIQLPSTR